MIEIKTDPASPPLRRVRRTIGVSLAITAIATAVIFYSTLRLLYVETATLDQHSLHVVSILLPMWTMLILCIALIVGSGTSLLRMSIRQRALVSSRYIRFTVLQPWLLGALWKTKEIQIDLSQINHMGMDRIRTVTTGLLFPPEPCLIFQGSHTIPVPLTYWGSAEIEQVVRAIKRTLPSVECSRELIDYLHA